MTYFGNVRGLPVGDVRLMRDRLIAVPTGSALVGPHFKRAIRYGGVSGGVTIQSIQNLVVGTRYITTFFEVYPSCVSLIIYVFLCSHSQSS